MSTVQEKSITQDIRAIPPGEPMIPGVSPRILPVEPELFRDMVAALAFYKAEQRGFEPGHELEDWLEAEQEFLNNPFLLTGGKG